VIGNNFMQSVVAIKRFDLVIRTRAGPAGGRTGIAAVIHNVVIGDQVVALNGADARTLNVVNRVADKPQVMRVVTTESMPRKSLAIEGESPELQVRVSTGGYGIDHSAVGGPGRRARQIRRSPNNIYGSVSISLVDDPCRRRPASQRIKSPRLRVSSPHKADSMTRLRRLGGAINPLGSLGSLSIIAVVPVGRSKPYRCGVGHAVRHVNRCKGHRQLNGAERSAEEGPCKHISQSDQARNNPE